MKSNFTVFLFLFLFSQANAQTCTYLAYENFGATPNTPLNGGGTGSNWAANWDVQNGGVAIPGYQFVSNSLSYLNLQSTGNHASGGSVYLTAGRRLNTSQSGAFVNYTTQNTDAIGASQNGGILWFSAMLQVGNNFADNYFVALHDNNIAWCNTCGNNRVEIGYFGTASDVGGVHKWSLRIGTTVYPTTETIVPSQTAFCALKMQFNAGQTLLDLYVNPTTLGNSLPASPTLTQTTNSPVLIRSLSLYLGSSANYASADELRFATSYPCVAPDNTVTLNLPPTAAITANITSGTAPLSVNFDGSASFDPENQLTDYTWDFGDGSPNASGASLTTTSHTFTALGILPVTLTVTDNVGQSHTFTQNITVTNNGGTFPCLSSITSGSEAHCGQSDGVIQIHIAANTTATILNSANQTISPGIPNGTIYDNLAPDHYSLYVNGQNGCKDTISFYVNVDSSTCTGWQPNDCAMNIGLNLTGLADWEKERPFRNLYKLVRSGFVTFEDNCNCWDSQKESEILTDTAGYPLQVPQTTTAGSSKVRLLISSDGGALQSGKTYVFLYDGNASFVINGGVTIASQMPGRVEFTVNGSGNHWIDVSASTLGNHLRNIRLVRLADEFTNLQTTPFYQTFLDRIAPFKALRFMDWNATNSNHSVQWSDRKRPSYRTYSGSNGVPYEMMIQLGNTAKKDVWICMPHLADDNYLTQVATLFRDNLDPKLTIYLEYSNEVWNWMFDQAHYNAENAPANLNYGRAYAERAKHVFEIWKSVFGAQGNRVQRVLGMQGGYNYLNEQILSQLKESDWDYGSPTFYMGLDHGNTGNPVLNAASTPQDVLTNARNAWFGFKSSLKQDYRNVHVLGKKVINYEGGQHFTNFTQPPYLQAMYDAQIDPGIYTLYNQVLDSTRLWGSNLAMAFVLAGTRQSIYGSWGHLEDIDEQGPYMTIAPKYQTLLDNIPPASCNTNAIKKITNAAFQIYPNPTENEIYVTSTALAKGGTFILYDILGKKMQEIPIYSGETTHSFLLNATIQKGVYLLTFEGSFVGKVVVR